MPESRLTLSDAKVAGERGEGDVRGLGTSGSLPLVEGVGDVVGFKEVIGTGGTPSFASSYLIVLSGVLPCRVWGLLRLTALNKVGESATAAIVRSQARSARLLPQVQRRACQRSQRSRRKTPPSSSPHYIRALNRLSHCRACGPPQVCGYTSDRDGEDICIEASAKGPQGCFSELDMSYFPLCTTAARPSWINAALKLPCRHLARRAGTLFSFGRCAGGPHGGHGSPPERCSVPITARVDKSVWLLEVCFDALLRPRDDGDGLARLVGESIAACSPCAKGCR